MHWRLLKLNWSYGLGELIIVIVGVLIALAIEQWNSSRLDRVEEKIIVQRLASDVRANIERLETGLSVLDEKEASLIRVTSALSQNGARPDDPTEFLRAVIIGANYGWNQAGIQRATYDELIGSGKFSLIEYSELRWKITEYYELYEESWIRMAERETEYPHISYRLVPRDDEFDLKPNLAGAQLEQLVTNVIESSIGEHIIAELNLTLFIRKMINMMLPRSRELRDQLEAYGDSISSQSMIAERGIE